MHLKRNQNTGSFRNSQLRSRFELNIFMILHSMQVVIVNILRNYVNTVRFERTL